MADYQAMYHQLFAAQTKAIEILQKAQQITEEMYMDSSPAIVGLNTLVQEKSESYPKNTLPERKQDGKT